MWRDLERLQSIVGRPTGCALGEYPTASELLGCVLVAHAESPENQGRRHEERGRG